MFSRFEKNLSNSHFSKSDSDSSEGKWKKIYDEPHFATYDKPVKNNNRNMAKSPKVSKTRADHRIVEPKAKKNG